MRLLDLRTQIVSLITLLAAILVTAFLVVTGYVLNTTIDFNLAQTALYSILPTAAKTAFGTQVTYSLDGYAFLVAVVLLMAIGGTVAIIFYGASQPVEGFEY